MRNRNGRWRSAVCLGLLVVGGLAIAGPAWAAEQVGSKSCGSAYSPYLTTTRGTNISNAVTLHQWSKDGVAAQSRTGYTATFTSSFANQSSGDWYASTSANSLTVNSVTCGLKAT